MTVSAARALFAEPSLGPAQTLEVYDPLVAKIDAVLDHRRMLVTVRSPRHSQTAHRIED